MGQLCPGRSGAGRTILQKEDGRSRLSYRKDEFLHHFVGLIYNNLSRSSLFFGLHSRTVAFLGPRADTSVHLGRWGAALRSLLPEIRCEDGPLLLYLTLLMAWEIAERLSTGAPQAGKFWKSNILTPSVSELEFFVARTALWVTQSWGKDAGATTLRRPRCARRPDGFKVSLEGETSENEGTDWSWRYRSRLRRFFQFQVTKQEKEGLRIREPSVLLILGVLGAWGWLSRQWFFFIYRWWSLHSDGVCRNTMEALVQAVASTSSQPTKASL